MATAAEPASGAAILQDLRSFNTTGSLLHIAAHPDDENTALITYFARGRGYRTAYLSLTRGDGGQNEIGPHFDEKLGVARTHELLAARKLDGGRQFFTRAIDFGYSKTAEETLAFWDRKEVLGDVVRVIRMFRPDVIVTRFAPDSSGSTHGHHTASGMLGVEAFKLAGDPQAYPEQLDQGLSVWQPTRVVLNTGSFGGTRGRSDAPSVRVDIGGTDPVTGETFATIAARSRAMHITQGFGNFATRAGAGGPNEQTFVHLDGSIAQNDLFDGIDTTWSRLPGGDEIGRMTAKAIAAFNVDDPAASVPALLAIRAKLQPLPNDPVLDDKRAQLDRILQACLGLQVQTFAERPEFVPGESVEFRTRASLRSQWPVTYVGTRGAILGRLSGQTQKSRLKAEETQILLASVRVPIDTPITHPYWLRLEGSSGIARVEDPRLIGLPQNPAAFALEHRFEIEGQTLVVPDEIVHREKTAKGERLRRVDVIPPVSLRFNADVLVLSPGTRRSITVEIRAARGAAAGTLRLELPDGWRAEPSNRAFNLSTPGAKTKVSFELIAPANAGSGRVTAVAEIGGQRYSHQRIAIDYEHLPLLLLQPPARARIVSAEIAARGHAVGYLPGAGDDTVAALEQLGYRVTTLGTSDLTAEKLRGFDAVVIGVRAFNERKDLAANLPALWSYIENGGTVVAQYNRPSDALPPLGPHPLSIAGPAPRQRVTDERSPVAFLAPDHPVLNTPNKITLADFDGWVQERGAYFPSSWDEARYTPILALNDPGEAPLTSSVLVAKHGKGHYVYTSLAFFRQLPAGVPGAYRLLANLVSLGK